MLTPPDRERMGRARCRAAARLLLCGVVALSLTAALAPLSATAQDAATQADRATTQAPTPDRAAIAALQSRLNALGYDAGPADGLPGPRTGAAISAWQRDRGLTVTGRADADTIAAVAIATAEGDTARSRPKVAGTRPGAVAAPQPAPPRTAAAEPTTVPGVSSPARRASGPAGSISARRGLGGPEGGPIGLTPHGRRPEASAPGASGLETGDNGGLDRRTVRADAPPPSVRHTASDPRQIAERRPQGVGTLPGEGRIGARPRQGQQGPGYADRRGPVIAGDGEGPLQMLSSLPFLPAITPPDWLTKTGLAGGLGGLALFSLLCHRFARRRSRNRSRNRGRHAAPPGPATAGAAAAAPATLR
ncbi:MAG: peptidoglycan-binding domain-containing protein [Pseudomonadota bacterium]